MSTKQNDELALTIRNLLINEALKGDSHLASGLGIVELMIALCEVYDFDHDKIFFDIGHQRFPYLLLRHKQKTGRLECVFDDERYDMFTYAGFSGLSASSAMGYALAHPDNKAIAFIGDGAITGGEIYEALNHIGEQQSNVLVILNQNGMSISKNVGALADGTTVKHFAKALKFEYIGLVDGYDTDNMIGLLAEIKDKTHPVLLHVKTTKGKGFEPAEQDPRSFHSVFYAYDKQQNQFIPDKDHWKDVFVKSMNVFENKCLAYLAKSDNIYITTPANPPLKQVRAKYRNRLIDTGINEQHCMTLSTSLAEHGKNVILTMFGCFLSRCYSQVYDLCAQGSPLAVVLNMPGVTAYGATHQAVYDLNLLRMTPNATIMHPANLAEYDRMLDYAIAADYPVFLQAPKDDLSLSAEIDRPFEKGKGVVLQSGAKLTILPIGSMFEYAHEIAKQYEGVEIINPRFIKPFDFDLIEQSVAKTERLLILEDGLLKGGVGEEVVSHIATRKIPCRVKHVACQDKTLTYTRTDYDLHADEYGISYDACLSAAVELLNTKQ